MNWKAIIYNVFNKQVAKTSERWTFIKNAISKLQFKMQQLYFQLTQSKGRIALAMSAINCNQFKSVHYIPKNYDVIKTTLRWQCAEIPSQCDCTPNIKKFTKLEEKVIIQHSLELDSRGFSPQLGIIRDMANRLLAVHAGGQVGIRWPSNFVNWSPELKTDFNRKYDY